MSVHTSGGTPLALLEGGFITSEQLDEATALAEERSQSVLEVLLDTGTVDRTAVMRTAAASAGLEYVELTDYQVDGSAAALLPADFARRSCVLPLKREDGELIVAVGIRQAGNIELKDDLTRMTRSRVRFAIANRADIAAKLNQVYRAEGELHDLTSDLTVHDDESEDLVNLTQVSDEAPVVRFVNLLINQAISDRASDIHIEPTEHDLRVRYRIDGVLIDAHRSPKNIQNGVTSRLKIMAEMNIAERRIPQDGRMSMNHHGRRIDLRVATLPTVWGEKVVARILDNSNTQMGLSDLGFSEANYQRFQGSYSKPYGMILATGPTGSGKSTTLYATLNQLNRPEVNVITVEDPVEYRLAGINQVQTNVKAGLTFASALRSILRSDPDIVLIGEIRDHETAQIAIEAALTGHLVLSTLHTNDAPSAVTRLVEMGIEPFLVGSALDSVLAQRLCRTLCTRCREAYQPELSELVRIGFPLLDGEEPPTLYRPIGCSRCAHTGYRGRMALHEVMTVTEDIARMAVARASTDDIARAAQEDGMIGLRDDGWAKVARGLTSIEEILRVVVLTTSGWIQFRVTESPTAESGCPYDPRAARISSRAATVSRCVRKDRQCLSTCATTRAASSTRPHCANSSAHVGRFIGTTRFGSSLTQAAKPVRSRVTSRTGNTSPTSSRRKASAFGGTQCWASWAQCPGATRSGDEMVSRPNPGTCVPDITQTSPSYRIPSLDVPAAGANPIDWTNPSPPSR